MPNVSLTETERLLLKLARLQKEGAFVLYGVREFCPCTSICSYCQYAGCIPSRRFEDWYKAACNLGIVILKNDGPGFRVDIFENKIDEHLLATGWSDGFPPGQYDPDKEPPFQPEPLEALLYALDRMLKTPGDQNA